MTWIYIGKSIAAVLTIAILWLTLKELRKMMKESREGRVSDKCELD